MGLGELLEAWKAWSAGADRSEDGWESDFPQWRALMDAARAAMLRGDAAFLDECFTLSEEDEELLDFARDHVEECLSVLEALSRSTRSACRWQVYAALAAAGPRGEGVLRHGLADPDDYARRRAILALARHAPPDAQLLAEQLVLEADAYIRLAAVEMIAAAKDADFRQHALHALLGDREEFVRTAARAKLAAGA